MNATKNGQKKWHDLGIKDQAALITACASFVLGFILLFLGMFIDPAGEIDSSVLTAFGTALLYAAGIFGVAMYFKQGNTELRNNIMDATEKMIEKRMRSNKEEEIEENEQD